MTLRSVIFKVSEELRREPTPEPPPIPMEIPPPLSWRPDMPMPQFSPRIPFPMDPKGMMHMSYGPNMLSPSLTMKSPPLGGPYGLTTPPIGNMLPPDGTAVVDQERPSSNPLLANLLEVDSPEPDTSKASDTPVLSKLLEDSSVPIQSTASLASSVPHPPQTKATRGRPPKRRSQSEVTKGKSPKHRVTEYDHSMSLDSDPLRQNSVDSDIYSQGSMPESVRQHHLSGASTSSTGSASGTTVIDLTSFPNDSPMKRLEHFSDNLISKGHHPDNADVFMVSDVHNHVDARKDSQHTTNTFPNTVPKNEAKSTSLEELLTGYV